METSVDEIDIVIPYLQFNISSDYFDTSSLIAKYKNHTQLVQLAGFNFPPCALALPQLVEDRSRP